MHSFNSNMSMIEIVRNAQKRIENKLRLAFRVIWYSVIPVPKDEDYFNQAQVFCCLYHCGKWVFCCEFKDFEDKFNFKEEI